MTENTSLPRFIDCFLFYNELDMLEYRLTILDPIVHAFVIVEASQSFIGTQKPFFLEENQTRFAKFLSKIVYVKIDSVPFAEPDFALNQQWENEKFQRDAIAKGIKTFSNLDDNDIILLSDIDEIFDPVSLQILRTQKLDDCTLYSFRQLYMCYNINTIRISDWFHAKCFTVKFMHTHDQSPTDLRLAGILSLESPFPILVISRGGWHLSYFGSPAFVRNKLENFSHQEFRSDTLLDESRIGTCIERGTDIMAREDECLKFVRVPVCVNPYLPPLYDTLLSSYIIA